MKVGASQVEITPELPFVLAGSWHIRRAVKVLDPLYASCIAIESEETALIWISCDLSNIKPDMIAEIRSRIRRQTGISESHIIVSATHTHQGPKLDANLPAPWTFPDSGIKERVIEKIVQSAIEAMHNKQPAKMGYGKGSLDNCSYNRRFIMSNGRGMSNPITKDLEILKVEGPTDDEVQVVWFETMDQECIAVMVNYSSHPTVLYMLEVASGDYPGSMRQVIQSVMGKTVPVLFLQGASGNVSTENFLNLDTLTDKMNAYKRIGRMLGGEAIKLMSTYKATTTDAVRVKNKILSIPYRSITEQQLRQAEGKWAQYSEQDKADRELYRECYHAYSVLQLHKRRSADPNVSVELTAVRLGDIYLVTNPVELFVEFQLQVKEAFRSNAVILVELTNGYAGYSPTRLAFAMGGYETDLALSSHLHEDAGSMIANASIELIGEIRELS